jgi:hypothetical protein
MIRQLHLFSLLGAAFAALVLSVGAVAAAEPAAARAAKPHKLTKQQKAVARKRLRRSLRRHPQSTLAKNFLRQAADADLTLPLTLRLKRSGAGAVDDELGIEWNAETFPWPGGFAELQPAPDGTPASGVIPLDGTSSLEAEFGNDVSGYAGPGIVEALTGGRVSFDSGTIAPAIAVSDYATTPDGNAPLCGVPTVQLSNVTFGTGRRTQSLLHLFGGTARVTLHVRVGTTTQVSGDCFGGFGSTSNVHAAVDSGPDPDPIVPISFDATFKISPGLTADGKLRLGMLSVPVGSAQPTTFARITMCVDEASPDCTVKRFPARLGVLQLSAEVLVGDISA